jgi:mannitol-1-phosphate 5-dehydrogenase
VRRKIVFVGAGAIGRGYLPWVLDGSRYEYVYVDTEQTTVDLLNRNGGFSTYRVSGREYQHKRVEVSAAYTPSGFEAQVHRDAVACFFSVGPRNVAAAAHMLRGTSMPLILCENEPDTVQLAKGILGHDAVYFAVPDVITSNTAPAGLLQSDPLSITTENGVLYVEAGPGNLHGELCFVPREELLRKQWTPKLYLHNTPHCIAAYMGALMQVKYVHEAMGHPKAAEVVEGAMREMLQVLKVQWDIPHDFLDWYADKELARFRSELLFDPVARVAREPLRKLELHGRLVGAAQLCLTFGVVPHFLLKGIVGALLFEDAKDPDHHIGLLREAMDSASFNRYVLGLRPGEPLDLMLRDKTSAITCELRGLMRDFG